MHASVGDPLLTYSVEEVPQSELRGTWRRRVRNLGILLAVWCLPGVIGGLSIAKLAAPPGEPPPVGLGAALTWQILAWLPWALWTALVIRLVQVVPFRRGRWGRAVLLHFGVGIVAVTFQILWAVALDRQFYHPEMPSPLDMHIRSAFLRLTDFEVVTYLAVVAAGVALDLLRRFRQGQLAAERLRTAMVQAQLLALRSQLNPHFLFNALNSIISLMDRDVPAAQRMVARLGELLRLSLGADDAEVPLSRELNLVMQYLEIERIRFGDRLTVTVDVPPDLLDVRVPNLVLQPLVENAVIHGVAARPGPGRVSVHASRIGDTLVLRVSDDGVGLDHDAPRRAGHGIGIGNTRARLVAIYGDAASLTLRPAELGGAVAEVRLPLSASAAA